MVTWNLQDKKFHSISNSDNGEVSAQTIFHYRQKGNIVWATYEGGDILFGTLSGRIEADKLQFTYQHQNLSGEFMTGKCTSIISIVNNKYTIHEEWEWTCKDFSKGHSTILEI